jgi:hypothetical protein
MSEEKKPVKDVMKNLTERAKELACLEQSMGRPVDIELASDGIPR